MGTRRSCNLLTTYHRALTLCLNEDFIEDRCERLEIDHSFADNYIKFTQNMQVKALSQESQVEFERAKPCAAVVSDSWRNHEEVILKTADILPEGCKINGEIPVKTHHESSPSHNSQSSETRLTEKLSTCDHRVWQKSSVFGSRCGHRGFKKISGCSLQCTVMWS